MHRIAPRGRRAQAEMLEWFPRIILMIVAVTVIVLLVRVYTNRDVDSADLTRASYIYRLYYDDIIMYSDPATMRVYPGVVDVSKLSSERLDKLLVYKEPQEQISKVSSRIVIAAADGCAIKKEPVYNNGESVNFEHYSGASDDPLTSQMTTAETVSFPVTLKDGGLECPGMLNITVVRTNS